MSAAIVQNGEIVWERGLGFQNLDDPPAGHADTPYPIADLSATLAATLMLDAPRSGGSARRSGARVRRVAARAGATVRQILNHTRPAQRAKHSATTRTGTRNSARVIETCVPQPYRKTVAVRLLERLAMKDSVPGRDVQDER